MNFISGGLAGVGADLVLHGMDTLKTRMQGQLTTNSIKYSGIQASFKTILKEEGFRGLYGGLGVALVGSFASTLVYFATYEGLKRKAIDNGLSPTLTFIIAAGVGDVAASVILVFSF